MTKQERDFRAWAKKEIAKLQKILLLEDFVLHSFGPSGNDNNTAQCRYPYKDIMIGYSDQMFEMWKAGKKDAARHMIIHELCHSITDPLYCKAIARYVGGYEIEDERERLTDHIGNIVIKGMLK